MEIPVINGLVHVKSFLSVQQQAELLEWVDSGIWSNELRRRVQHFGYRYDYKAHRITLDMKTSPIPEWGERLIGGFTSSGVSRQRFDQLIINEYVSGQGIAPHIDCVSCFANDIISLSLGSVCVMSFSKGKEASLEILLEPGDLLLFRDEARFQWRHQIKPRKHDTWNGLKMKRERRVSLTFRSVIL